MIPIYQDPKIRWVAPAHQHRISVAETLSPIETVYFLLELTLETTEGIDAELLISSHSRYKLYVNGEFVAYGPCKSDEYHRYAERLDLSTFLRLGINQILAKVVSYPARENESGAHSGPNWSYNKACGPCLMTAGEVTRNGEVLAVLGTGIADWQYRVSDEMTPVKDKVAHWLGYKENVDGAKCFSLDSLPTTNWEPVVELFRTNASPWGEVPVFPLYEREIPLMTITERTFVDNEELCSLRNGVTVPPNSQVSFRLDAGELTTGFFRLHTVGGAGATIEICYAEAYFHEKDDKFIKKRRDDSTGIVHGHSDIYHPTSGEQWYEPFWFRTFRYVELRVHTDAEPLNLYEPLYQETGYPLEAVTSVNADTEPWIQQIWDLSLRTLRRCMHETYEDCPYYEQLQYTMDTRLQMLFTYAVSGDIRLAKKTIYEYHASKLPNGMLQSRYPSSAPQVIPVFSLHWIFMLEDYYQHTGDKDYLRGFMGTVDQVLWYFNSHKQNGLVTNLGYWETVDWAEVWDDNTGVPHACLHGASTIQNLQYTYALKVAAGLWELFDFRDMSAAYRKEAETLEKTIMALCWDEQKQLLQEGPGFEQYSQHAQLWAVLCGFGTPELRQTLLQALLHNQSLIPCSYPTMFYLFRAFEQEGMYEATENLWDKWKVLLDQGLTTVPEISFGFPRSDCHAWGSLLLHEFPRRILGVRHGLVGFDEICVEPKGFYITHAEGMVKVPGGQVYVKRTVTDNVLSLIVKPDCPQPVTVCLPDGTTHCVTNWETTSFTSKLCQ